MSKNEILKIIKNKSNYKGIDHSEIGFEISVIFLHRKIGFEFFVRHFLKNDEKLQLLASKTLECYYSKAFRGLESI